LSGFSGFIDMPIYEYQCQSCGHSLEKLQRIRDEPLKHCPECGEARLHRLVSAAAFRLKGAGWYETDFKKGDKKNLHESGAAKSSPPEKSTPASSKSVDTKKAESKPKTTTAAAD
jgi:putative FmdB family regulatory protein